MSQKALDSSLELLGRYNNPKNIKRNLNDICRLVPDLAEDLLSYVDVPLSTRKCEATGKSYLICDYNRDGDSYRSPWSNKYYPAVTDEDAPYPPDELRRLEEFANDSFDIYRDLYYEGGISSVYLWDQEDEGFAGVFLIKKETDEKDGSWDSVHVVEVVPHGSSATYILNSSIILNLDSKGDDIGELSLSGSLGRRNEKKMSVTDFSSHISNIGQLIEDIESKLRNMLKEVYFGKTKDILGELRSINKLSVVNDDKEKQNELIKGLQSL